MTFDSACLAQQSSSAAAFEAGVLQELDRRVGFDAAFFLTKGLESSPTVMGLAPRTLERLVARSGTYARELLPVKAAAVAARGVAVDTDVFGFASVEKTHYYREMVASVGGRHSLLAYLSWQGRVVGVVMLGRGGRGFTRSDLQLVERALPGLGVARAAFGLPWVAEPLPPAPAGSLLQRWLPRRSRVLASVRGLRGTLVVREQAGVREMVAQDARSAVVWTRMALNDPTQSGWPYVDLFHLAPALSRQRCRALFIGSGGGVSLQQFARAYPGIAIDLVEEDPQVIALARSFFALDRIPNLTVHIEEGATFLARANPHTWDVVVNDAFEAEARTPAWTHHSLASMHRALQPGGAFAANLIGTLDVTGPVADFVASARSLFDSVRIAPIVELGEPHPQHALRNIVIVATRAAL